eukprot:tig00000042_g15614.t1
MSNQGPELSASSRPAPAPHRRAEPQFARQNFAKTYRGRPSPSPSSSSGSSSGLDVVLVIDASDHMPPSALSAARQVAFEVLDHLPPTARAAVILCPLSPDLQSAALAVQAISSPVLGVARLAGALHAVWILTAGMFPAEAQQAAARYRVTVFGILCGSKETTAGLEPVASVGRVYPLDGLEDALAVAFPESEGRTAAAAGERGPLPERYARVTVSRIFAGRPQVRIGQDIHLEIKVENLGLQSIPAGSKVLIKENAYFGSLIVPFDRTLATGEAAMGRGTLPSKGRGSHAALHEYLDLLPEVVEYALLNEHGVVVPTQEDAFCLEFQDFTGDLFDWEPPSPHVPRANVLLFGPMGNGKSSFFNSLCTSLSSQVVQPSIVGGTASHVTNEFFEFNLNSMRELRDLNFSVYDSWGLDDENYGGDEMDLILHGAMPLQFKMDNTVTENLVRERTGGAVVTYSPARKIHSVVFIVSGEFVEAGGEDMGRFAELYRRATLHLRAPPSAGRKAVVAISYADRFEGEAARAALVRAARS